MMKEFLTVIGNSVGRKKSRRKLICAIGIIMLFYRNHVALLALERIF